MRLPFNPFTKVFSTLCMSINELLYFELKTACITQMPMKVENSTWNSIFWYKPFTRKMGLCPKKIWILGVLPKIESKKVNVCI